MKIVKYIIAIFAMSLSSFCTAHAGQYWYELTGAHAFNHIETLSWDDVNSSKTFGMHCKASYYTPESLQRKAKIRATVSPFSDGTVDTSVGYSKLEGHKVYLFKNYGGLLDNYLHVLVRNKSECINIINKLVKKRKHQIEKLESSISSNFNDWNIDLSNIETKMLAYSTLEWAKSQSNKSKNDETKINLQAAAAYIEINRNRYDTDRMFSIVTGRSGMASFPGEMICAYKKNDKYVYENAPLGSLARNKYLDQYKKLHGYYGCSEMLGNNNDFEINIKKSNYSNHDINYENKEAIPIRAIAPQYPASAMFDRTEGYVTLKFSIHPTDGKDSEPNVSDVEVIKAVPEGVFDESAINALLRSVFKPCVKDGKPYVCSGTMTYHFNLPGR